MTLFLAGLVVFFGVHLLPVFGDLRGRLIERHGEPIYKTAFAVVSAIGFVMMLYGRGGMPFVPVFTPPDFSRALAMIVMLPAFVLLVAAYFPCNIRRWVGHPMLIAIFLWSSVHVLANGDRSSLMLFGAFLIYSVIDWISVQKRPVKPMATFNPARDFVVVVVGVIAYVLVFRLHERFFAPLS